MLRLLVEWELVPIEIEQPHPIPDLITAAGRLSPPEVVVDDDGESLRITYRWRALPTGDYTLCMHGSPTKSNPTHGRVSSGTKDGSTDPTEFTSASTTRRAALVGNIDEPLELTTKASVCCWCRF